MRQLWLQFHDKLIAGIVGLLPLIVGLSVRFTASESREEGVFKYARGVLLGWDLEDSEKRRVNESCEAEIVLALRPKCLFIRVQGATSSMPDTYGKGVFVLKARTHVWTRDKAGNVKVQRTGFPIVPDFSGTAHSYVGATLDADVTDCLPWYQRPSRDYQLRGYNMKARVRSVDKLLIVQPYSPQLFRQGSLPGPRLLMELLRGNIQDEEE